MFHLITLPGLLPVVFFLIARSVFAADEPVTLQKVKALVVQVSPFGGTLAPAPNNAISNLLALGTNAHPYLAYLVSSRDGTIERLYQRKWRSLPSSLRDVLGKPESDDTLRAKAAVCIAEMGPIASRALCRVICEELEHPLTDSEVIEPQIVDQYLLCALYWSLPDSSRAVRVLTNYLAHSETYLLFGELRATNLWSSLPETVPYLIEWLKRPDEAGTAASALATLGTNALSAIASLIDVAKVGVAGNPPNLKFRIGSTPELAPIRRNREAAIGALGRFGRPAPEVIEALLDLLNDSDHYLRVASIVALGRLQPDLAGQHVLAVVESLPRRRSFRFLEWMSKISELGEVAAPCAPYLERLAAPGEIARLSEMIPPDENDFPQDHLRFRDAILLALARIRPDLSEEHLHDLAAAASREAEVAFRLPAVVRKSPALIPILEGEFEGAIEHDKKLAMRLLACSLLWSNPENAKARQVLVNHARMGEDSRDQFGAAWLLWKATGDPTECLRIASNMLRSESAQNRARPLLSLVQIGRPAKALAPILVKLLDDPNVFVRMGAADCLRNVAPEMMPPITDTE